jgi:hypothetical protein
MQVRDFQLFTHDRFARGIGSMAHGAFGLEQSFAGFLRLQGHTQEAGSENSPDNRQNQSKQRGHMHIPLHIAG